MNSGYRADMAAEQPMRAALCDLAKGYITKDRAATHGKAEDIFAAIAGHWTWWLGDKLAPGEAITAYDVAQMMVGFKQARGRGNPGHMDNHADAIGYAAIAGEIASGDGQ